MRLAFLAVLLVLGGCGTTRDYAPAPSVQPGAYRGFGSNPVWELTIDRANLLYTDESNRVRVSEPNPARAVPAAGQPLRAGRLQVLIARGRCTDSLTQRMYPERVQVTVDGRRFDGCGGQPLTTALAESRWLVESVNGKATGGGAQFAMQFAGNRMTARFGCNTVAGSYAVTSITFSAGAQATTRMACRDPSFETQALQVLAAPATLVWQSADQVTIGNERGQIKLRRAI